MLRIFCDGGLAACNPSPIGGSWAYCFVDYQGVGDGTRTAFNAGFFTPEEAKVSAVSNNVTELFAAVAALQAAPPGWDGILYTDSRVTQCRIARTRKQSQLNGIPQWLRDLVAVVKDKCGPYTVSLLGGHPTKRELASGFRKDGARCSIHNVYCDRLATEQAAKLRALRQL